MTSSINNYGYGVSDAARIDSLFSATLTGQSQLEGMANAALNSGIDKFIHKDYEGAAEDFRRAVGIAPQSSNAVTAADHMANAYLKSGETGKALEAYKTAVSLDPTRDDMHVKLGNLNFSLGRHTEAETAYRQAVTLNPDATNVFSLGQLFLNTDRPAQAMDQFEKV
ncbi:MAG: tetratricopeptide repeat protein, partial [Desulfobacterales bacterium]|nr:tetratricopeptide repeat protein [Desulfobacterales bacterium]